MIWRHFLRTIALASVVMLGAAAVCARQPAARGQLLNLRGQDSQTVTSGTYKVKVTAHVLSHTPAESTAPPWGAGELHTTWRMITSIEIWRGKARISVPRSAFADLANANSIAIRNNARGCVITMAGGDAAYAWRADIWVNAKRITRRTVRSAEFPGNYWEETRYVEHFPPGM